MYSFRYRRPRSVDEALALFNASDDPKFIAGGMTLLPTLKMRLAQPTDLIDLNGLTDNSGVSLAESVLTVGAATRHVDVAYSRLARETIPALAELAAGIGDPQVRNRGTIGGSIANNDPAADYPAAVLALDATVVTDRRQIAASDFFVDMFETALAEDEIVTAVRFPVAEYAAYAKFPNPASRYAVVGVFVAQVRGAARVAVTGAAPCVYRSADLEALLENNFSADAIAAWRCDADGLNEDIHASAAYRAHLVRVMAQRAVSADRQSD